MSGELSVNLKNAGIGITTLTPLAEDGANGIYLLSVSSTDALSLWHRLKEIVGVTKHWPVILGDEMDLEFHREALEDAPEGGPAADLEQGRALGPEELLKRMAEEYRADGTEWNEDAIHGDWPQKQLPRERLSLSPRGRVQVGLVPTLFGWEVPAYLAFGGWNDCPFPVEHVCLLKYWHERHGAELVALTHDTIQLSVAEPPTTRAEALKLAEERFAYCSDSVEQGAGTLEKLAATMLNGHWWCFWWD